MTRHMIELAKSYQGSCSNFPTTFVAKRYIYASAKQSCIWSGRCVASRNICEKRMSPQFLAISRGSAGEAVMKRK